MKEKLQGIREEAFRLIKEVNDLELLNKLRVRFLGKKGEITGVLKGMGQLLPEERPIIGALANKIKNEIESLIEERKLKLEEEAKLKQIQEEEIDVTLPGQPINYGHVHPLTAILTELKRVFLGMGFDIAEGPEIEKEYYNFEALNIPRWHPARDMQDTFFITEEVLLRTHTSPVQVRTMEKGELPIRIIAPGRVYRVDELDATHSPNFQQLEGLVVDKGITFGHLKETINVMVKEIFGKDRKTRFRPSYFPFTEPSAEVDVSCILCDGKGCRICKGSGWLEIMGCGMVHPRVLEMSGIDPEQYSGFAFGMGLERIAMLKYGITDIRLFYENDLRFLSQF
ncbi:phenylalanine--tRNA ligase subunit alpha [Anoxybacter fermentans]|uniref:Phenylalanine--tRNA ligase alpha subunit n=1 Tax=Anoxybacter fermentans TaxID=1323375 RepID=A0A3Q9HRH1_9FIRM|nr:phenylalanine--tRNA ligase subunit alpha [Anoxybacter fermentans]AZR73669.1 phenylalanine--tRNA ligase subunit alpha [Anoxybacter fermentans]